MVSKAFRSRSGSRLPASSNSVQPITAVRGVRSSWEIVATSSSFKRLSCTAPKLISYTQAARREAIKLFLLWRPEQFIAPNTPFKGADVCGLRCEPPPLFTDPQHFRLITQQDDSFASFVFRGPPAYF